MANDQKRMIHIQKKLDVPTTTPNMNGRIYPEEVFENAVQDYVKKMRRLNEELDSEIHKDLQTPDDQPREEAAFNQELEEFNVMTEFIPLEVYDDYVFWGGSVDGYIKFVYRVPAKPGEEGVKFSYNKEGFNVDDADNIPITDAIKNNYDKFFKYWRDNNEWREGIFSNEQGDENEVN